MLKKIFVFLGVVLLIGFVSVFVRGFNYQKEKSSLDNKTMVDTSSSKKQELIDEETINSILEQENKNSKEETPIVENNQPVQNQETSKKEVKQNNSNTTTNTTPKVNQEKKVQSTQQQNSTNNDKVQNQPKQSTPWEDLGISENDYYNSPMWGTWADITYKVENYSSRSETELACQTESQRLLNEEQKASSCTPMNSYSGRYLGEYLKVR